MRENTLFALFLGINFLILVAEIHGLSISFYEATLLYGHPSLVKNFITVFLHLFGMNDYALRIPMIVVHLLAATLLYKISDYYVSRPHDKLWIIAIYLLLPGITSSALLVTVAGFKLLFLFAFVYSYLRFQEKSVVLLPLFLLLDATALYFYGIVAVYALFHRKWVMGGSAFLFFGIALGMFEIHFGGVPKGHFLDVLGIYSAIFSPFVFIYLFYVLYRRYSFSERDLVWFIASAMFVISALLSFRQKVIVQDFAPYLMIALPLAAQTFFHTYRVRLPQFRWRYRLLFYSSLALLVLNALAVFFNQWGYVWVKKPKEHFAYSMHVAKELAYALKEDNITCLHANDEKMALRLHFYGIEKCTNTFLSEEATPQGKKVTISYTKTPIYTVYVTKINK
ncbi:MAG: hypothetical protein WA080_04030 [Sulfuricurvum sp.]